VWRAQASPTQGPLFSKEIFTATIPYGPANPFLYRAVFGKLKLFRRIFGNEECAPDGFIVKPARDAANQLFFSTTGAAQSLAAQEMVQEIVTYRHVRPTDGDAHANKYVSPNTHVLRLDAEFSLFVRRVDGNLDLCCEVTRLACVLVHAYQRRSGKVVLVIQGAAEDCALAICMLTRFSNDVLSGCPYDIARDQALMLSDEPEALPDADASAAMSADASMWRRNAASLPAAMSAVALGDEICHRRTLQVSSGPHPVVDLLPPSPLASATPDASAWLNYEQQQQQQQQQEQQQQEQQEQEQQDSPPQSDDVQRRGNKSRLLGHAAPQRRTPSPRISRQVDRSSSNDWASGTCIHCGGGPRRIVYLPCAHLALCPTCDDDMVSSQERRCYLCDTIIESRIRVFLA